ncbi:hypothetical protein LZ575_20130 [Antarcticibacterium sp. 1MA-6-2]|uniref:hypothetical protein n=1 Tax=Antarcticibacterium sp. 1MA-6-2 TaxID=2908210 RepID=UPI001F306A99|nr:hypothetical protein [Antarcticibacterium sp. 1MA-6-2]UJH90961.1 hypothetical protein LZ575_20130 [Antarcticibacterium sp. 1MA-6-2]
MLVLLIGALVASCEYGRQAEEQFREINTKATELDGMVTDGLERVTNLDSILPETSKKIKEADSIINNASSTLDSLRQKADRIERIFN